MVGGGSRRDDGALGIRSSNVFSALEALKKKKKSDKESKGKGSSKSQANKEPEPQVFWAPSPLIAKSWADVDDDDDYYATTAPPQSVWGVSDPHQNEGSAAPLEEESESEDDGLDEGDDDVDEAPEHEYDVPVPPEPVAKKPLPAPSVPKDTERQLSKKELKKKGLAELDAVLAELGISGKDTQNAGQDDAKDVVEEKKSEYSGNDEKNENGPVPSESKTSKKKKAKKDKSLKEVKDQQEHLLNGSATDGPDEVTGTEGGEEDASAMDVKERLKKVASMKKKKSSKETDAASRAAAIEAAARSAKLAAAKKKEKNHYNQQPVR